MYELECSKCGYHMRVPLGVQYRERCPKCGCKGTLRRVPSVYRLYLKRWDDIGIIYGD